MDNLNVSIDRITISGDLEGYTLQDISMRFPAFTFEDGSFVLNREDSFGNRENMAYLIENKYKYGNWRIDFNPTNLTSSEKMAITLLINHFKNAHFTRLDIAFDIFNDSLAMNYRVYRFNVSEIEISTYRGRNKSVETIYWGKRKSEQQIRLYDKLKEQQSKGKEIPKGISSWARLELQLRGKKPTDWIDSSAEMLSQFKIDNLNNISDPSVRSDLYCLIHGITQWSEFSSKKCAKLRKLITESDGFDNSLSLSLQKLLAENSQKINKELHSYLVEFGID